MAAWKRGGLLALMAFREAARETRRSLDYDDDDYSDGEDKSYRGKPKDSSNSRRAEAANWDDLDRDWDDDDRDASTGSNSEPSWAKSSSSSVGLRSRDSDLGWDEGERASERRPRRSQEDAGRSGRDLEWEDPKSFDRSPGPASQRSFDKPPRRNDAGWGDGDYDRDYAKQDSERPRGQMSQRQFDRQPRRSQQDAGWDDANSDWDDADEGFGRPREQRSQRSSGRDWNEDEEEMTDPRGPMARRPPVMPPRRSLRDDRDPEDMYRMPGQSREEALGRNRAPVQPGMSRGGAYDPRADSFEEPRARNKDRPAVSQKLPNSISPAQLTKRMQFANSTEALTEFLRMSCQKNGIHISIALARLGQLRKAAAANLSLAKVPPAEENKTVGSRARDSILWSELMRQAKRLLLRGEVAPREVASSLGSLARLLVEEKPDDADDTMFLELVPVLLQVIPSMVDELSARSTAEALWALFALRDIEQACVLVDPAALLDIEEMLVNRARSVAVELSMQDVAQILWTLSSNKTVAVRHEKLFSELAVIVTKQAPQANERVALIDLPQIACAFGRIGMQKPVLLDNLAFRLTRVVDKLKRWELAALTWSFRAAGRKPTIERSKTKQGKGVAPEEKPSRIGTIADFPKLLADKVAERGLTKEEILRSRDGPDSSWYEEAKK